MYPWQSVSSGCEETQQLHLNPCSGRWLPGHSRLQRHVGLTIAYNVWQCRRPLATASSSTPLPGGEILGEVARYRPGSATFDSQRPVFDAHVHIIDPRFPLTGNDGYLPPAFTVDQYGGTWGAGGAMDHVGHGVMSAYDAPFTSTALMELPSET